MASAKPLTLRRQRSTSRSITRSNKEISLQAEVLVDTGIYHLGDPFSYGIPDELSEKIERGSVVNVPFASKNTIGIVVSIGPVTNAGLKNVLSLVHDQSIQPSLLELADQIVKSTVCQPFDAYRYVLPIVGKKQETPQLKDPAKRSKPIYESRLILSDIGETSLELLLKRTLDHPEKKRLIIFPTVREVKTFAEFALDRKIEFIEYGSYLSLAERKRSYGQISSRSSSLVVGTRSAIFAPFQDIDEIIVIDEWSEHYLEQKNPYWNLREVALLRAKIEQCRIFFLSSSASLEMIDLLERGMVAHSRRPRFIGTSLKNRLYCAPNSYLDVLRRNSKKGPVLVTVAEKNYSNLFICQKCRNVARCSCGGRITMLKRDEYLCSLCSQSSRSWRCSECESSQFIMLKAGIQLVREEIGKSIPNIPVFLSTQDKEIAKIAANPCIVITTSGMEPTVANGYSAIVLLNGEELAGRPFVRAEEELLQRWFKSIQYLAAKGEIYLSLSTQHRISQAILTGDPLRYLLKENIERSSLGLPPSRKAIKIESKGENLKSLKAKLINQFPSSTVHLSRDAHSLLVISSLGDITQCVESLRALQKVRSVQSKTLLKIAISPYHL